jgi:epoxyqueuosine reductase
MDAGFVASLIKSKARKLGFELAGITSADPPPHYEAFQQWILHGYHGEMAYLAGERAVSCRADPHNLFPDGCSVVVLGFRYPPAQQGSVQNTSSLSGRVAAYAWGEDYHLILPQRMRQLVNMLEAETGMTIKAQCFTDSAPLLERDLAQRAGLGWIGKNTCLINPQHGSYLFLAEIVLDLELPPDPPFEADRCGTCRRCIDACPTRCILPDRTLDARRCISYLTIELKTAIPEDLRPALDGWVFGCDICQMVCPWNHRASMDGIDSSLLPKGSLPWLDLVSLFQLTPEQFRVDYRDSALQRAKARGLARNAAVVLGNLAQIEPEKREQIVRVLSRALMEHPEPLVRSHAAWALGQTKSSAAREILGKRIKVEQEESVLQAIHSALNCSI